MIDCANEFSEHVALPRGCLANVRALLAACGVTLITEDKRHEGEPVAFHSVGALTPVQGQAARALLAQDLGVFVAPPGIGKTAVGTFLVAARGRSTLVLSPRVPWSPPQSWRHSGGGRAGSRRLSLAPGSWAGS